MKSRTLIWILWGILIVIILLIIAIPVSYWWYTITPGHPSSVTLDAVWLWGPKNPIPGPKYGQWIKCWSENQGKNACCRIWDKSGKEIFEGKYIPYKTQLQKTLNILEIDQEKTGSLGTTIRGVDVSVVFLKNGEVLIPEEAYSELVKYFDTYYNEK